MKVGDEFTIPNGNRPHKYKIAKLDEQFAWCEIKFACVARQSFGILVPIDRYKLGFFIRNQREGGENSENP